MIIEPRKMSGTYLKHISELCVFEQSELTHDASYRYWGAEIAQDPPTVEYAEVMEESGGEKGVGTLTKLIVCSPKFI